MCLRLGAALHVYLCTPPSSTSACPIEFSKLLARAALLHATYVLAAMSLCRSHRLTCCVVRGATSRELISVRLCNMGSCKCMLIRVATAWSQKLMCGFQDNTQWRCPVTLCHRVGGRVGDQACLGALLHAALGSDFMVTQQLCDCRCLSTLCVAFAAAMGPALLCSFFHSLCLSSFLLSCCRPL